MTPWVLVMVFGSGSPELVSQTSTLEECKAKSAALIAHAQARGRKAEAACYEAVTLEETEEESSLDGLINRGIPR